ncbi:MAG: hypothetical protein C4530_19475 [Desulfobacteraceae bacterium]|nr:MAG: hypothetical protein C4530_19475 [Desulfobacteraceae bacterium]
MSRYKLYTPLALALAVGILLQAVLIAADQRKTPQDAAIAFSKAYFMLDPSMADWLCKEQKTVNDVETVDRYLDRVAKEAKEKGYGRDFMKSRLYDVKTKMLRNDGKTAEIRLTGKKRFAMNPLYAAVGQIFGLTKASRVEEVLSVAKENGQWKVCGTPFQLAAEI